MPGIVVEHMFNSKGSSESENQKEENRYDLFRNDFSSVNETQRICEEQEAQKKALLNENTRKQQEQESAAQLAKDYAQAITDRDEARQDHLTLKREKLEVEQKSSAYEAKINTYESERQALQDKVDSLTRTVASSMPLRNNLSAMYHGKNVSIVNIAGRTSWDISGRDSSGNHLYKAVYDPGNKWQQFFLEQLPNNGNWTMYNIETGKYLEVLSGGERARIHACDTYKKNNSNQEWWITWTPGGLSFENVECRGRVVDLYAVNEPLNGRISITMHSEPTDMDPCKLWTILQTKP